MRRPKKRIMLITISALLISMFLASTVYAVWMDKNIKASYRNIKIFANGEPVKIDKAYEPFITNINGKPTTFVPLRALSEILGKEIKWTQKNYRIDINDKETPIDPQELSKLKTELILKDNEIANLNKKVAELEAKLKEAEKNQDQKRNLTDLEKYLNKQYGHYDKIDFDIRLSESKGDIKVNIVVDLDRDYSQWNKWDSRDKENYIDKILKEIRYDFKDAKVSGEIEDKRSRDKLVAFYTDSRDRLVVDSKGSKPGYIRDIKDMEDYLNNNFYIYNGVEFGIYLNQNKDRIDIVLAVHERDWNYLDKEEQDIYLEKLYREINHEFPKAYVRGTVYGGNKRLIAFEFDSNGDLIVK